MLPSFEEIYRLTDTRSSETAFSRAECQAYYDLLTSLPQGSRILEIGLEWGRSSSIVMQLQQAMDFDYIGIDPWKGYGSCPGSGVAWMEMLLATGARATVYIARTEEVAARRSTLAASLSVVHIDGDHRAEAVAIDVGYALEHDPDYLVFHDWADSPPEVGAIVMGQKLLPKNWHLSSVVDRLAIWAKMWQGEDDDPPF